MRQSEAMEILDTLLFSLGKRFAEIEIESEYAIKNFENTLKNPKRGFIGRNVLAMDVRKNPPQEITLSGAHAMDEEFIDILVNNLNNQHLWLLVQAFEAIEKYYKDFYGALGYLDENLWQCEDFGKVRLSDVKAKDLLWFQNQVRETKKLRNVDAILKKLHQIFPAIDKALALAKTKGIDLEFNFKAVAFFRHKIVHEKASILEKELIQQFEDNKIVEKNSPWTDNLKSWVHYHFKLQNGIYTIWMIDWTRNYKDINSTINKLNDNFDDMLRLLVSHVCLTYAIALFYFGQKPFWERRAANKT